MKLAANARVGAAPDIPLDFARYVPASLLHVSNKLSNGANALYRRKFGVNVTEWRVLAILANEPDISAQRIREVVGFDKAVVSRVLKALDSRALVKIVGDVGDGRRHRIALSGKGRALYGKIVAVALEREKRLLSTFTPEEVETLIGFLLKLNASARLANAYDPDA